MALVYRERPGTLAELAILEECEVPDVVRFLTADAETRQQAVYRVLCGEVWLNDHEW